MFARPIGRAVFGGRPLVSSRALVPIYGQSLCLGVNPDGSGIVSRAGSAKTISGATQANPVVVTAVGHGFASGSEVVIVSVGGMTQINDKTFEVRNPTADTFELYWLDGAEPSVTPVDGTGFGAYTSGGTAQATAASSTHKMFNGGVRPHYDDPDAYANVNSHVFADTMAALVPLQERIARNQSDNGETIAYGMGLRMSAPAVFATMARAAYSVENLSRNETGYFHFSNLHAAVLHGSELVRSAGGSFRLAPIPWLQGESDGGSSTEKATYKTRLGSLRSDLERSFKWAALQAIAPLKMVMYQQAMSAAGYAEIAVAAIELHRETDHIYCLGPLYWLDKFSRATDVHLKKDGYRVLGELFGLASQAILNGIGWEPCHIIAVNRVGTTLDLTVHVPEGALVEDTSIVATVANKGFTISGNTISSVTITDDGATDHVGNIRVVLGSDAGCTISYAYANGTASRIGPTTGARGNIRDSAAAVALYDGSHLYNWLCTDQWVVA